MTKKAAQPANKTCESFVIPDHSLGKFLVHTHSENGIDKCLQQGLEKNVLDPKVLTPRLPFSADFSGCSYTIS